MASIFKSVVSLFFVLGPFVTVHALLRDGDIYKITSVANENVLTIGGKAGLSGSNVTADPWQDGGNQKWLAVESAPDSDNYILIPKWQSWNWNDFAKNSTKGQREHLPDFTVALTVDKKTGLLTNQGVTGKEPQQWTTVEGKDKAVLLKNLQDNKCIINPGEPEKKKSKSGIKKLAGQIGGLFKKTPKIVPVALRTASCESSNTQQLWRVEPIV